MPLIPEEVELLQLFHHNNYHELLEKCRGWCRKVETSHYGKIVSKYLTHPTAEIWIHYLDTTKVEYQAGIHLILILHSIGNHYHILFSKLMLIWDKSHEQSQTLIHFWIIYATQHHNTFVIYWLTHNGKVTQDWRTITAECWYNTQKRWISSHVSKAFEEPFKLQLKLPYPTSPFCLWYFSYPNLTTIITDVIAITSNRYYTIVPAAAVIKWPFMQRILSGMGYQKYHTCEIDLSAYTNLSQHALELIICYLTETVVASISHQDDTIPVITCTPPTLDIKLDRVISRKMLYTHAQELVDNQEYLQLDDPIFVTLIALAQDTIQQRSEVENSIDYKSSSTMIERAHAADKTSNIVANVVITPTKKKGKKKDGKKTVMLYSDRRYNWVGKEGPVWLNVSYYLLTPLEMVIIGLDKGKTLQAIIDFLVQWYDHATICQILMDLTTDPTIAQDWKIGLIKYVQDTFLKLSITDVISLWCYYQPGYTNMSNQDGNLSLTQVNRLTDDVDLRNITPNYLSLLPVTFTEQQWIDILQLKAEWLSEMRQLKLVQLKPVGSPQRPSTEFWNITEFLLSLSTFRDHNDNTIFHLLLKYQKLKLFKFLWNWMKNYCSDQQLRHLKLTNALHETIIHLLLTYTSVSDIIRDLVITQMRVSNTVNAEIFNIATWRGNCLHYACLSGNQDSILFVLRSGACFDPDALIDDSLSYFAILALYPTSYASNLRVLTEYFNNGTTDALMGWQFENHDIYSDDSDTLEIGIDTSDNDDVDLDEL